MKLSELKLKDCANFEAMAAHFAEYFGPHYQNVIKDFEATNIQFLKQCGDMDIDNQVLAESALINYFMYYCFGVGNTIDPKSKFNENYDDEKAQAQMDNIEEIAKGQE